MEDYIERTSITLLELPTDLLVLIWQYLSLPDVVKFALTAKNMLSSTWKYCRKVNIEASVPISAARFALLQDLTQIREFWISCTLGTSDLAKNTENISFIFQQMEKALPTTLQSLSLSFYFPSTYKRNSNNNNDIQRMVSNLLQLQSFEWVCQEEANQDVFDCNQLFAAHSRLTSISVTVYDANTYLNPCNNIGHRIFTLINKFSKNIVTGFSRLTQLNKLDLLCCSKVNDNNLEEIITLTKLTHLGIGFIDQYTSKSITRLSNLVNLQHIDIQQTNGMTVNDIEVLCQLPKLTRLEIDFGEEIFPGYYDPSISIIGQLSTLTHLTISMSYNSIMNVSLLTKLTNLDSASFNWCNPVGDLSVFAKMTNLNLQYSDRVLSLPANLQYLMMGSDIINEDAMKLIVNLTNLHTLHISAYSKLESNLGKYIEHLTHLTNIRFTPTLPKEIIPSLCCLSNLAVLSCQKIPSTIISDLKMLTQLLELNYWTEYNRDLKSHQMPFRVTFSGGYKYN